MWRGYTLYCSTVHVTLQRVSLNYGRHSPLGYRIVTYSDFHLRFSPLSRRRTSARKSQPRYVILSFRSLPRGIGKSIAFSRRLIIRFDRMKIFINNTPFMCFGRCLFPRNPKSSRRETRSPTNSSCPSRRPCSSCRTTATWKPNSVSYT